MRLTHENFFVCNNTFCVCRLEAMFYKLFRRKRPAKDATDIALSLSRVNSGKLETRRVNLRG